jgi:hypothetical protein
MKRASAGPTLSRHLNELTAVHKRLVRKRALNPYSVGFMRQAPTAETAKNTVGRRAGSFPHVRTTMRHTGCTQSPRHAVGVGFPR